jgi:hypothetical protein
MNKSDFIIDKFLNDRKNVGYGRLKKFNDNILSF